MAESGKNTVEIEDITQNFLRDAVTAANLAAIEASLDIMDDWDESNRAKVNPIVGQAGVAAGVGVVGATVPRVLVASDDLMSAAIQNDVDGTTTALRTVTYEHHEMHSGSHYLYRSYYNVAKAGVKELLIVTPAGTKWAHMVTGFMISTSTVVAEWFEGVTTTDDGTEVLTRNRNRNVADNNTMIIYEDPTVSAGAVAANIVQDGIFGAGGGSFGGGARDNEEVVLLPSTKYLVRFTEQNVSAVDINFSADWYEHTDS